MISMFCSFENSLSNKTSLGLSFQGWGASPVKWRSWNVWCLYIFKILHSTAVFSRQNRICNFVNYKITKSKTTCAQPEHNNMYNHNEFELISIQKLCLQLINLWIFFKLFHMKRKKKRSGPNLLSGHKYLPF